MLLHGTHFDPLRLTVFHFDFSFTDPSFRKTRNFRFSIRFLFFFFLIFATQKSITLTEYLSVKFRHYNII